MREVSPSGANRLEPHLGRVEDDVAQPVAERLDGNRDAAPQLSILEIDVELHPIVPNVEVQVRTGRVWSVPRLPAGRRERVERGRVERRPASEEYGMEKWIVDRQRTPSLYRNQCIV